MNVKTLHKILIYMLLFVLVTNSFLVHAVTVDVDGVEQGTDDVTYAKNAPLSDIVILNSVIANYESASYKVFDTHPGFKVYDPEDFESITYNDSLSKAYTDGKQILVYDESVEGAVKITGNTGSMNTFTGDIAAFTYKDAALLPDGSKGDVIITYSDISLPMQNNFGKHNNNSTSNTVVYSSFYGCDSTYAKKLYVGNLKDGYTCSDFWGYDSENDRGYYKKAGVYTIGYGYWMYTWNNIVRDARTASNSSHTTRYGLKMNIKIQVKDKSGKVVNGTYSFPLTDIDINRKGNSNFGQLYNYDNENYYSESIRVNSGVDKDGKIYIPGDIEGNADKQYKATVVNEGNGVTFIGTNGDADPGTTYSGFVTVVDNKEGMNLTFWTNGASNAAVNTYLLNGSDFHKIVSSSGTGGTIQTTKKANPNGNLSDNSKVFNPGTVDVPDGKTVKYTMTPEKGYKASSIKVDGKDVKLPKEGKTTTIELDGPDGAKMTGTLVNQGNGKFSFIFPDNNYDHKIHVDWEIEKYPITYDLDGGTNNPNNPDEYTVFDNIHIKEPTKEGYRFLGWVEGDEIPTGSTGAKHFTAKWEKIVEPVTPNTSDNVMRYTGVLLISFSLIGFSLLYITKPRKNA